MKGGKVQSALTETSRQSDQEHQHTYLSELAVVTKQWHRERRDIREYHHSRA